MLLSVRPDPAPCLIYHQIIKYHQKLNKKSFRLHWPKHSPCRVPVWFKCNSRFALRLSASSERITVATLSPPSPAAVQKGEETRSKAELIHSFSPSGKRKGKLTCHARLSVAVATWDVPLCLPAAAVGCRAAEIDLSHPITQWIHSCRDHRPSGWFCCKVWSETHSCGNDIYRNCSSN